MTPLEDSKQEKRSLAIMFADIVGSTKLYDKMGDTVAQKEINDCLSSLAGIVVRNHGEVVKTIGDEIMCCFINPDHAATAAIRIQEYVEYKIKDDNAHQPIRIGIHYGQVIIEKDDLFGDAVNVASRVADLAKGWQIIITHELHQKLSANLGLNTRKIEPVKIKGKEDQLIIYELMWSEDDNDQTVLVFAKSKKSQSDQLLLNYDSARHVLCNDIDGFIIGRGSKSNVIVQCDLASRTHAIIEYHNGKFILKDQSSNGTYVKDHNDKNHYLHNEEIPLVGEGSISLGEPISQSNKHVIRYHCI